MCGIVSVESTRAARTMAMASMTGLARAHGKIARREEIAREKERERERGAAGANWEGGAERWDGGRFLPARKIFRGVYVSKSNFSEHFLDNTRSPVPSVAILENILHFHQTNAHGPSLCILEKNV